MKIGIIGHGYCGQATEYLFSNYIIPKPEIAIHDPDKGHFIWDWSNISYAFICVPTNLKGDKLDTSIIEDVLKELEGEKTRIVIRSTIGPDQALKYVKQNAAIIMPEFLRENSWKLDVDNYRNPLLVGGHNMDDFIKVLERGIHHKKIIQTGPCEASMIKCARNSFLAVKVGLMNDIKDICDVHDIDYREVARFFNQDVAMGNSHTKVPGWDGKYGFGGSCLPKDLTHTSNLCYANDNIMKTAIAANEFRRKDGKPNRKN